MTAHNPEHNNEQRKHLLQKYLQKLTQSDPNLYYSATTDIARALHPMIQEHLNRMSVEERALLKNLSVRDIEMLLSFQK